MKIRPVRAELLHADEQTDRHDEAKSFFFAILRKRLKQKNFTWAWQMVFRPKATSQFVCAGKFGLEWRKQQDKNP